MAEMAEHETVVAKYLIHRVYELDGEIRKVTWTNRAGAPDYVIMYRGITAWVEAKSTNKKPSHHQCREHERLRTQGQWVIVLDSKASVDQFISVLKERSYVAFA